MQLVEGDGVGLREGYRGVCGFDERLADVDGGGEADYAAADARVDEGVDGFVDVGGVNGVDCAEDEKDFARAVGGGVAESMLVSG